MENDELFKTRLSEDAPAESLPLVHKNNVHVVVRPQQSEDGKRNDFPDDCGPWDSNSGTTVIQVFVVNKENKF